MVCLPVITTTEDGAQGGVCLVIQDQPHGWNIEAMRSHGTNVVGYKVITGGQQTPTICTYLPTYTLEHLPDLEEALVRFWDKDTTVIGDISDDIGKPQNPRNQQVDGFMKEFGLVDPQKNSSSAGSTNT